MFWYCVYFIGLVGLVVVGSYNPEDNESFKSDVKEAKELFWNNYVMGHFNKVES